MVVTQPHKAHTSAKNTRNNDPMRHPINPPALSPQEQFKQEMAEVVRKYAMDSLAPYGPTPVLFQPSQDNSSVAGSRSLVQAINAYQAINGTSFLQDSIKEIFKQLTEIAMQAELDAFLGYDKYERTGKSSNDGESLAADGASAPDVQLPQQDTVSVCEGEGSPQKKRNFRNGYYQKTVITQDGPITLNVPRDRNGEFSPAILPKGKHDICGLQERVLNLVAEGHDLRSVARIIKEMLGVNVSHEYVNLVIKNFHQRLKDWQERRLQAYYPFVFIDCLYVKARDEKGVACSRPVYVILGIDGEGKKELLSLEMCGTAENKQDWMKIFDKLHGRGVQDISFACMDGVKGVDEGLKLIFPRARTQRCMVHLMRNSWKHVGSKKRADGAADCKKLYASSVLESGQYALRELEEKWATIFPSAVRFWKERFDSHVAPLYELPFAIRRVIYTTNAIESVNNSLRKVVQRGCYANDENILTCMLLRADRVLATNWHRRPIRNWALIREQLLALDLTREVAEKYLLNHVS